MDMKGGVGPHSGHGERGGGGRVIWMNMKGGVGGGI